ncbi:hypothetical protein M569_09261, partial [Genlisea aurea]
RIFAGTWNVGGNVPNHSLKVLEHLLQVESSPDLYVLGFQEIVPLNAGNVLVMEANEPATKWLALISQAINKPFHDSMEARNNNNNNNKDRGKIFRKPSLKDFLRNLKVDDELLKRCNCPNKRINKKLREAWDCCDQTIDEFISTAEISIPSRPNYQLVASKQMVGIFLSIWARRELVKDIGHLRISCMGRGIMGYLGNKGCISVSMTLHQTSFCFICSHLASGEKEGDELKRNSDVSEILKGTSFSRVCKRSTRQVPENINDHDRAIWLGDLNYRIGMRYHEAKRLMEDNDWDTLLQKDQLNREREAGRVFVGWKEGKIMFPPTYKYTQNSDSYAGETAKSKRKRRTPAW